jgi:uncharacterized membrane protein
MKKKKVRKIHLAIIGIIVLSFAIGLYFYPQMSSKVASHWDIEGNADGYMSKFWGLFLMPIISLGLFLLFLLLPKIDPLKNNINKFRKYFDYFVFFFILFLFYLFVLTILWNLGWRFNMSQVLAPAFGLLFLYVGFLLGKAKRNWFIGIRTPWTLSNNKVWERTHEIGAKLFMASGIIIFLGLFLPDYLLLFVFISLGITLIYTVGFSYFEYQKVSKKK